MPHTLAPLRKGSCQRKLTEGSSFQRRIQAVPIRLLRCPDRSLTAKPAQRATDGRPYELKSVPTKAVAIRTTGNCADLVQNFALHPCLPLEGKVSAKPTDEVKFNSCALRTHQLFIIHLQAMPALPGHRKKCIGEALIRH